jgi:LuxR family transcriptional regulator, maltose regulon positive regulatory protein
MSCLALGTAAFMLGDEQDAWRLLREGADTTLDRPIPVALCLAHLAIIDIERGRWDQASSRARRARAMVDEVADLPASVFVLAISMLVETQGGRHHDVAADRVRCRQHFVDLVGVSPLLNLQPRIALARAALIGGNRVEASALLDEVDEILTTTPGAVGVARQVAALRRETAVRDRNHDFGPGSLTTAELRVLQLLPTHLTVGEIADRLYVSRNTVKSQTIAIYRKLGTSSRSGAVDVAVAAGLLEGTARHA